jgi:hypothetical protein
MNGSISEDPPCLAIADDGCPIVHGDEDAAPRDMPCHMPLESRDQRVKTVPVWR